VNFITRTFYREKGSPAIDLAFLSLIFGIAFFQFLNRFPLLGTDEARYMEIPREMLERGDFVTPTLNYVSYFEKPPLHYWVNALATVLFGETAFAGRFFGALWGVLGVLMVYHLGRRLFGRRAGIISALVLGTSLGVMVQGRVNITDTTLTFCLCAALGSFLLASRREEQHKSLYFHLFYVFAALAVLAKGLIGLVLPGAIIFFFILLTRRFALLKEMRLLTGIPLFLLVCAPWFVMVSLRNPDFLYFFFIHEHFARYLTKVHGRYQPPWFFLPILFGCMLPWSFFLPVATLRAWRDRKGVAGDEKLFLLLWAGLIFGFFSMSDSKLIPYILPVYPALALLLGYFFSQNFENGFGKFRNSALVLTGVHIFLGVGTIAYPYLAKEPKITCSGGLLLGGLLLLQGVLAAITSRAGKPAPFFYGLLVVAYFLGILGPPVIYETISKNKLNRDLALLVKAKAGKDDIVASFGYEQELPYYTKRRVLVVGGMGELEFGSKQGDQSAWFIQREQFSALWSGPKPVFVLVSQDALEDLRKTLKPAPILLGLQGRHALITNKPDHAVN
jgi:4-amino-4-deoxy-L-arabinose transferase-like glycosyltransferase